MSLETIFKFFEFGLSPKSRPGELNPEASGNPPLRPIKKATIATDTFACLTIGSREVPLLMVRHRRARRYLLRVRSDGTARVTIPRNGTASGALQFAQRNRDWLERQLARAALLPSSSSAWRVGGQIWFRGELLSLQAFKPGQVQFGTETVKVPDSQADLRPVLERYLRRLATQELPAKVMHHAAVNGLKVARVTVRNQKSRWGSCSSTGTLSLNWRLIQTPQFVCDYIILHELAHLRHMNHSTKFWREVESLCPDYPRAKKWLREHRQFLQ
jgi:predicted metal-dependent hydrolase